MRYNGAVEFDFTVGGPQWEAITAAFDAALSNNFIMLYGMDVDTRPYNKILLETFCARGTVTHTELDELLRKAVKKTAICAFALTRSKASPLLW